MTSTLDATQSAPVGVDELSAAGLLAEASSALWARRGAEVVELELAYRWAVLHGRSRDERDPMVTPGGDGTPSVQEYAVPELALARETHPATTRALVADVLDLMHRLPLTWARVQIVECEPWVARKVAVLCRSVPAASVGVVDRAVAAAIGGQAPLEHTRATEHTTDSDADGDTDCDRDTEVRDGADEAGQCERPVWAPEHLDDTVARLAGLSPRQLASMHGRGTVFVHVTERALSRQAGIARVEGVGPMLVQSLAELLGHADVTIRPGLDLADRRRVDAYEHPDRLKDHVWAQAGGDVFPFSPRTATRDRVDFDHPTPYVPPGRGGPAGQTGAHNSGPLRRSHPRWKTHGGSRCRQAGPGRHLWQTPHGLCFPVDHTGTRALTPEQAETMLTAPPGVEIYWP